MKYILAIIILAILFSSNPNLEEHQKAVNAKISQLFRNQLTSKNSTGGSLDQLVPELGVWFGTSLIDGIVKDAIKRKDFFFFSLTNLEYNGNNKIIGIGILGNVYLSQEIDKELNNEKEKLKSSWENISKPSNNNSQMFQGDPNSRVDNIDSKQLIDSAAIKIDTAAKQRTGN